MQEGSEGGELRPRRHHRRGGSAQSVGVRTVWRSGARRFRRGKAICDLFLIQTWISQRHLAKCMYLVVAGASERPFTGRAPQCDQLPAPRSQHKGSPGPLWGGHRSSDGGHGEGEAAGRSCEFSFKFLLLEAKSHRGSVPFHPNY